VWTDDKQLHARGQVAGDLLEASMIGQRVGIKPFKDSDPIRYGLFVGLISNDTGCDRCNGDGYSAVVQLDGHGMMLQTFHPSLVTMIDERDR
jgi:hypothetical protein